MRSLAPLLLAGVALAFPAAARADRCADLARPATFDADSAMEAIFCDYDRARRGTLLPKPLTAGWKIEDAETLASPLFAATYREAGTQKGVLVVQRQAIFDGEVANSHGTAPEISVYVFARTGGAWVFEKGAKHVAEAGTWGQAPTPRMLRLGDDKVGLLFAGGFMNQGNVVRFAFVVALGEGKPREVVKVDLGSSMECAEEGAEKRPCWEWEGDLEVVRQEGKERDLLRVVTSGTDWDFTKGASVDVRGATCFAWNGNAYAKVADPRCAKYPARPEREAFGVGEPVAPTKGAAPAAR